MNKVISREYVEKNYIHKDIIIEKIEWLKVIADNGVNAVRFAMTYEDEIKRRERQENISAMIDILQELLEETKDANK